MNKLGGIVLASCGGIAVTQINLWVGFILILIGYLWSIGYITDVPKPEKSAKK